MPQMAQDAPFCNFAEKLYKEKKTLKKMKDCSKMKGHNLKITKLRII